MMALLRKELRELYGLAAVALVCYLALVASLVGGKVFEWVPGMPEGTTEVPFVGLEFTLLYLVVSVVFAVALGFRQSAWESAQGTYLFLLHLPMNRDRVFLAKLLCGATLFLACAAVPVVLYGGWAATPGHHAGPFEWSMAANPLRLAALTLLLYLGAFLSGLRPARWYGTRLYPLAASAVFMTVLAYLPWYAISLALAASLCAVLITVVCQVARSRDYA